MWRDVFLRSNFRRTSPSATPTTGAPTSVYRQRERRVGVEVVVQLLWGCRWWWQIFQLPPLVLLHLLTLTLLLIHFVARLLKINHLLPRMLLPYILKVKWSEVILNCFVFVEFEEVFKHFLFLLKVELGKKNNQLRRRILFHQLLHGLDGLGVLIRFWMTHKVSCGWRE